MRATAKQSQKAYFGSSCVSPVYAKNGIIEAWVIDLNGEAIEVYRQPGVNGYQFFNRFIRGQTVTVSAFTNINFTVDEILG